MSDKKLCGILILLIPQIIKEIIENEKISEEAATKSFYNSKLNEQLEKDSTKLWHLSPKALYLLYQEEMQTGKITYPEEA